MSPRHEEPPQREPTQGIAKVLTHGQLISDSDLERLRAMLQPESLALLEQLLGKPRRSKELDGGS